MRVVIALGGNALLRRGEALDLETQHRNVRIAVEAVAPLIRHHEVVITHGNGPQIGILALQAAAYSAIAPYPLDLLGAETEGTIGHLLMLALNNVLPDREIATLLTEVEVDPADPAFAAPSKPIGPIYAEREARRLGAEMGWTMIPDGTRWRRAVASPLPRRIRNIKSIQLLLEVGVVVICAGGGGIPVAVTGDGELKGIDAVIDKDFAAALLAEAIGADKLLLLTDVPAVWTRWPMQAGEPIGKTTPAELRRYTFAAGSMRPKVEAACWFVERSGKAAGIGEIDHAEAVFNGNIGTLVQPEFSGVRPHS